ncbi:MAG: ribonuclease VapC [Candidatus Bathyarchaeota archaeon]|nr:ribonuclease VapC [Candidatus Bathyarchaeota archaeon]
MAFASKDSKKVLVLDTPAFIVGLNLSNVCLPLYTTPSIIKELKSFWVKVKCSTILDLKKLKVILPKESFLNEAFEASNETGDRQKLSEADLSVLALALELKVGGFNPAIVTDDFSVQNVAQHLNIECIPVIHNKIKFYIKWTWYCPACRRLFSSKESLKSCPVCGTRLKRKAVKT